MHKLNLDFTDGGSSIDKLLNDWIRACKYTEQQPYSFPAVDDVPEDLKPIVQKVRSELEARGIDPATIYPIDVNSSADNPLDLTVTMVYEKFESTNG